MKNPIENKKKAKKNLNNKKTIEEYFSPVESCPYVKDNKKFGWFNFCLFLSILTLIFGVFYITASIVAFVIAFFFSLTLQKFWTFKDKSLNGLHWQTGKYLATSLFGLGINTFFLYIFVDHFNFYVFWAQIS